VEVGTLVCRRPGCGRHFPVIDGLPILVADLPAYLADQRASILRRRDLPEWAQTLLDLPLGEGDAERAAEHASATWQTAHWETPAPELAEIARPFPALVGALLDRHLPRGGRRRRLGLDAGAGAGAFTLALARRMDVAVGLELHFATARAARERVRRQRDGRRATFVVADAENPPFPEGAFDVVLALNLLDVVAHPTRVFAALDRCLRPGGLLVVTTPFAYTEARTVLAEQLDEAELLALLDDYEILDDHPRVPWHVPIDDRHHHVFLVRALAARRRGEPRPAAGLL
jgi:SAM-dependent methyltransferase